MSNTILLKAEAPVINDFLPATSALTAGIFISLCKDIAQTVHGFSIRSSCEEVKYTLAYYYTEWRWNLAN